MQVEQQVPDEGCSGTGTGTGSLSAADQAWDQDAQNPFNWAEWKKWLVMMTSLVTTFVTGMNATAITTAGAVISEEFNLSDLYFEYNFFAVTGWNAAAAFVPLVTLPVMESYGMRIGYLV